MNITRVALFFGIVFVIVAILGFIPGTLQPVAAEDPGLILHEGHGRLLGLFPVNILHNLVHLALGIWGLVASRNFARSVTYCRGTTWIYGLLGIMGLFPGLNTVFGLVPIHGHDVWLHLGLAAILGYFGYVAVNKRAPARSPSA